MIVGRVTMVAVNVGNVAVERGTVKVSVGVVTVGEGGGAISQNHISRSPPRRPSPLGSLILVLPPPAVRVPNTSPSRYKSASLWAQIKLPLRVKRASTRSPR